MTEQAREIQLRLALIEGLDDIAGDCAALCAELRGERKLTLKDGWFLDTGLKVGRLAATWAEYKVLRAARTRGMN